MLLAGKTALVTGAAGGLGLACATSFAAQGARVVLSDVQDEKGEAAAESLRGQGADACYQHCDVALKDEVGALIDFYKAVVLSPVLLHFLKKEQRRK